VSSSRQRPDLEGLTTAPDSTTPDVPAGRGVSQRRDRGRLIAAAIIGAVIAVFAVVNLDQVRVHWIVTTGKTPLILVIAVAFLLGMVVDRLVIRVRRKRQS
jgi:uncharacterized integral membrane protein